MSPYRGSAILDLDAIKARRSIRRAKAVRGGSNIRQFFLDADRDLAAVIEELEGWRCICHEDISGACPYCVERRKGRPPVEGPPFVFKVTTSVELGGYMVAYQTTHHQTDEKTIVDVGAAVGVHQESVNVDSFVKSYLGKNPEAGVIKFGGI